MKPASRLRHQPDEQSDRPHTTAASPTHCATIPAPDSSPAGQSSWTFLTNHAHVLLCVFQNPESRVRDVAQAVGVTERCVQRILADLEKEGYLTHSHHGRRNSYQIRADLPLRHPIEQHRQVSALLRLSRYEKDQDRDQEV